MDTTIVPYRERSNEGGPAKIVKYISIRFEITERKNAESQLVNASKMASLGAMAGGVAHEINNPLAIISGKANQLVKEIKKEANRDAVREVKLVEDIQRTAMRIGKIIKGLRTVSRDGEKDPFEVVTVTATMNEVMDLCRTRLHNRGVEIKMPLEYPNLTLECRATQISQVFLNLLNNADDAIESLPEKWIEINVYERGETVVFEFTDSGNGIAPDVRQRMMEPFFTTKPVGKGTGLGLSISMGIIQNHQGSLSIDTTCSHTRFVVVLPKRQPSSLAKEERAA